MKAYLGEEAYLAGPYAQENLEEDGEEVPSSLQASENLVLSKQTKLS